MANDALVASPAHGGLSAENNEALLSLAERVILQEQYEGLDRRKPQRLSSEELAIRPGDVTCLFQVPELVFSRNEGCQERLTTVMNSLHACGASGVLILQCQEGRSSLYLGAVNKQRHDNPFYLNTMRDILRNSISGNLPGTELREIKSRQDIEEKLGECFDSGFNSQCVTSISCVSGVGDNAPAQLGEGLERLLEAIGGKNFTLLVLADPVSPEQISEIRRGYEELSTQLSALEQSTLAAQRSESTSISNSFSKTFSESIGESISMTQTHSSTSGWSKPDESVGKRVARGALSLGGYGLMSAVMPQATASGSEADSSANQKGSSRNVQNGTQENETKTVSGTQGATFTFTSRNRHVKELLDRVEWYLGWLNKRENYGMFSCAAYVISSTPGINLQVASQYQAIVQGHREMSQPVAINTWTRESGAEIILECLDHMTHPRMECPELRGVLTPAMLLSSKELSRQMALPQKPVVGVGVMEYAAFGREVIRKTPLRSGRVMRIGTISHMGQASPNQPVLLDMQSLAAHTFIAGTNGSGKSNAVFRMLEELLDAKIPFMVIEPAKGEYKNVFGREPGVQVYGTNRAKTELLRLNPFWFNEDVAVLEHIDKLIEVFNASWPMYAAMPAVLKASIENAYRACGWNLTTSVCKGGVRIFPTVRDVLNEFNNKMESTAFSQEVKGNYVGALSTRMESLCNGIYGEIFGGLNLTDQELFDSNVIVDLSRTGSAETKAMIMGMLLIRLQEYRMSGEAMNLPLRHITVLEEAHHLLRRASVAQSDEGSNMLGKSVEMISNSIAEMRSYGEGFIIVDQSPGLLDMSVMRNTNTKLILRLPESGDRDMVGNTMGLTAEQIYELSRLKTGCCAIYQKDWLEAVLCQVDRASHEEELYVRPAGVSGDLSDRARIAKYLLSPFLGGSSEKGEDIAALVPDCAVPGVVKRRVLKLIASGGEPRWTERRDIVQALCALELERPESADERGVSRWYDELMADKELLELWGESYLPLIIKAEVQVLAQSDEGWDAVLRLLPSRKEDETVRRARGLVFSAVCPSTQGASQTDRAALERAVEELESAGGSDGALAALGREYLRSGKVRRRGELHPYVSLVSQLMGGNERWNDLYPALASGDCDGWDRAARDALGAVCETDRTTETSILSLFLQAKGSDPVVKAFFPRWLRAVRAQNMDV